MSAGDETPEAAHAPAPAQQTTPPASTPTAPPSPTGSTPQVPPTASTPQVPPTASTPQVPPPPTGSTPQVPPTASTPQVPPTASTPQVALTDETPSGAPTDETPSGAPTDETPSGAPTGETPQVAPRSAAPGPGPKLVRRVVVSYRLGWLPGDWLQTWRRLDRVFGRAELNVKATLAPLEDLPPDTDILVVSPDLREAAHEAAPPGTPILVTPASAAAGAFADLVSRLQAGTEFTAERLDPADKDKPKIVSYRGHTLLD